MTGNVVFYQLSRKFVNPRQDVPAASKQLIHYTLAIGHHIGIIDCLSSKLEVPADRYADWIAHLAEGDARRKLARLARDSERTHQRLERHRNRRRSAGRAERGDHHARR